jgi:hypothetical protein
MSNRALAEQIMSERVGAPWLALPQFVKDHIIDYATTLKAYAQVSKAGLSAFLSTTLGQSLLNHFIPEYVRDLIVDAIQAVQRVLLQIYTFVVMLLVAPLLLGAGTLILLGLIFLGALILGALLLGLRKEREQ